jgi:multiple sugar transport system permease protein
MAGSVLAILPILIVYIAGQRYFVRGIATSGMK